MSPALRMLAWREWHERRFTLLVCLAWMLGGTLYSIAYSASSHHAAYVASFWSTTATFGIVAPIFIAMRTALGEATDRTRGFSDGLPVSPRLRGWLRLFGGGMAIVVPILSGALLSTPCLASGWLRQAPWRMIHGVQYVSLPARVPVDPATAVGYLWLATAIALFAALTFYVALALVGTWFRSESSGSYTGGALAALWFFTTGQSTSVSSADPTPLKFVVGSFFPEALIINYGYGDPLGDYGDLMIAPQVFGPLACNLLVQLAVGAWFVGRYARRLGGPVAKRRWFAHWPSMRLWQPWLPTRGLALTWLTLRQALPLSLPGLALACFLAWMNTGTHEYGSYRDTMTHGAVMLGIVWGTVVGAGAFAPELDRRLGEYWRVLPIPFGTWFALKFVISLAAVLLVIDGAAIAVGWNAPRFGQYNAMGWGFISVMVPFHILLFSLAMAWTCLLRRPVLGAIAALATFTVISILVDWSQATRVFAPFEVYNLLEGHRPGIDEATKLGRVLISNLGMLAISLLALLAGWRGLKRYGAGNSL